VLLHGYVGDGPTTWRRRLEALGGEFTLIRGMRPAAAKLGSAREVRDDRLPIELEFRSLETMTAPGLGTGSCDQMRWPPD
jgi:hypothetical protein